MTYFLADNSRQITVAGRTNKFKNQPNIDFSYCDLTDKNSLNLLFSKKDFDAVIHLASFNEYFEPNYFQKALKINTEGTYNLLQSLKEKKRTHFIYFSTFHVYGQRSGVVDETTPCEPKNDYASTHLFAEYIVKQYCTKFNIPYTIIRLTNSYGCPFFMDSSKWYLVLNDLSKMAFEKEKIVLQSNGEASRDFIWMGDVVKVIEQMILNEKVYNNTFNLGSETSSSILSLARIVKEAYKEKFGKDIPIDVNKNDKQVYDTLQVSAHKLKKLIPYHTENKFKEEVNKIFNLLAKVPETNSVEN